MNRNKLIKWIIVNIIEGEYLAQYLNNNNNNNNNNHNNNNNKKTTLGPNTLKKKHTKQTNKQTNKSTQYKHTINTFFFPF